MEILNSKKIIVYRDLITRNAFFLLPDKGLIFVVVIILVLIPLLPKIFLAFIAFTFLKNFVPSFTIVALRISYLSNFRFALERLNEGDKQ